MKRIISIIMAILLAVILGGCVQDSMVVRVKADGTGTINETVLLSNDMLELMESFASEMTGPEKQEGKQTDQVKAADKENDAAAAKKTRDDMIENMAKDAQNKAVLFGPAVTFVSVKPVKTHAAGGYSAVYAFQDINQVKINQNPSDKVDVKKPQESGASKKEEFLQFKFTKGSPSRLVVIFPERKEPAVDRSGAMNKKKTPEDMPSKEPDDQSLEMMKNLFENMKLSIALQIDGNLVKTDATYREGTKVTLLEMDFGKIVSNPTLLKQMNAAKPQTIEETKALLKGIEGLKIELKNPVTIEFN